MKNALLIHSFRTRLTVVLLAACGGMSARDSEGSSSANGGAGSVTGTSGATSSAGTKDEAGSAGNGGGAGSVHTVRYCNVEYDDFGICWHCIRSRCVAAYECRPSFAIDPVPPEPCPLGETRAIDAGYWAECVPLTQCEYLQNCDLCGKNDLLCTAQEMAPGTLATPVQSECPDVTTRRAASATVRTLVVRCSSVRA